MLSLKEHANKEIHAPGTKVKFPHKGATKTGKVVRYEKGGPMLAPHYVIYHGEYQSAEVPPHEVEKYTSLGEAVEPKFERATKTEYHYTGRINNKTYVVPHSYNYEQKVSDKVTPMHHHVVVSLNHTIHNNPSLTPEEHARVNAHIKDIHGGQQSAKLEESYHTLQNLLYYDKPKSIDPHLLSRTQFADWCGKSGDKEHSEKVHGFFKKHGWLEGHDYCTGSHNYAKTTGYDVIHHPNFKKKLDESFMSTYKRNEGQNRHTANIVHLAKHFGDESDKAQARFYQDEQAIHGHNKHTEAQYELHKKLWPKAMKAHGLTEGLVVHGTAQSYDPVARKWSVDYKKYRVNSDNRKLALNHIVKKLRKDFPHHKEHEARILEEGAPKPEAQGKLLHCFTCGRPRIFKDDGKLKCPVCKTKKVIGEDLKADWNLDFSKNRRSNIRRSMKQGLRSTEGYGKGTKAWKRADKEDRRNRSLTVSAGLQEEPMIQEGRPKNDNSFHGIATRHQTRVAKQSLRMPDAMLGVMGGSKEDARAHLKKMGWTEKQIYQHEHGLNERALTPAEDNKKEEMVMSMKKNIQGFKERYGDEAKSVMYATAAKRAKELAESEQLDEEGLHAYKVTHKGKEIDKIFYGSHQDPEDVKRSLVNHDGYHPDIKVTKERKTVKEEAEQLDELSRGTLKSYIKKASPSLGVHAYMSGSNARREETAKKKQVRGFFAKQAKESEKIAANRESGIQRAAGKLEESSSTLKTVKSVLNEAFTRRHYKQIAELIKGHTDDKTRQRLANEHAKAFAKDNPRFSHEKFHAAAGTQYSHISNQDN